MVSKLNILQNYYHIPLEDQFTFTYDSHKYYLTNKPFPFYYQKYISTVHNAILYFILLSESGNGRTKFSSVGRIGVFLADEPVPEYLRT